MSFVENLAAARSVIERAGRAGEVEIVAVTKGQPAASVSAATEAGLAVGESYAQELLDKAREAPTARWHFIGSVQRNKVKALAPLVDLWHGLARTEEADAIAQRRPSAAVLVQVDFTGRPERGGCRPEDVDHIVDHCRQVGLDVRGLMTVAPLDDPRSAFRRLASARDRLGLVELSMGMSSDLEVAVAEGATIVRLGTSLFGPRHRASQARR